MSTVLEAVKMECGRLFGGPLLTSGVTASALFFIEGAKGRKALTALTPVGASCEISETKYDGFEYCPRVKAFTEVFSPRAVSLILTKNVTLNLMIHLSRFIAESLEELQEADDEDREPTMPPLPPLGNALRNGVIGSIRQATVLCVRWIYDRCVHAKFAAAVAFRLLRDARREVGGALVAASTRFHTILPVYITFLETSYTWLLADFTVAVIFVTVRLMWVKDPALRWKYWLNNMVFQTMKNISQLFLSPLGAVLGVLLTSTVRGTMLGYNLAELSLTAALEMALVAYVTRR